MNNRAELLFTLVCKRAERVSVEQFALQHDVTSRTVYKDVERLSALLQAKGYPRIDNIRGILEYKSPIDIDFSGLLKKNDLFYFDPEIRRRYIAEMILLRSERVSVASIQTLTGISRNTVLRDLDEIKELLAEKGILLESTPFVGYTVVGDELTIRAVFVSLVQQNWPYISLIADKDISLQYIAKIREYIDAVAGLLSVEFSEEAQKRLIAYLMVSAIRFNAGKRIDISSKKLNVGRESVSREYRAVCDRIDLLEILYNCSNIPEEEIRFLAAKMQESTVIGYKELLSENWIKINVLVSRFIREMDKRIAYARFEDDEKLFESIVNHLRPAYWRAVSGEVIENPLAEYVMKEYQELYEATAQAIKLLEEGLSVSFADDEITFITLLFAASLERAKKYIALKPRVIVVCHAGISTSEIVSARLESLFEVQVVAAFGATEAQKWLKENQVDFIVSTFPFTYESIRVIEVTPQFDAVDQKTVANYIKHHKRTISPDEIISVIKNHIAISATEEHDIKADLGEFLGFAPTKTLKERYSPMLEEVLTEDLVETHYKAVDRDDAVREAGRLLVKKGVAKEEYIEAMIENVKVNGTYIVIAPGIAMPHARPEKGAQGIGFALVSLADPVVFGHPKNDPVQLVIALCAIDHQTHLNALSNLAELLSDPVNVEKILQADTPAEVLEVTNRK